MSRPAYEANTATLARFAHLISETLDMVQALKAAGRLVLTDDGKRVLIQESIAKLRAAHAAGAAPVVPERTASFSGFARMLGSTPSYVTELKAAGRLVLTDDGKRVRVEESLALIRSTADPAKAGVAARHAATRGKGGAGAAASAPPPVTPPPVAPDVDVDEPAVVPDYDGHATRRSRAMADKAEWDARAAERDYLESMGQLLQADQVAAAVTAAGATLRTSLENLPNTLAPELAAATDEARVRVILGEAIGHALEEVSRQFAVIGKQEAA